jgi:hypothetical protein
MNDSEEKTFISVYFPNETKNIYLNNEIIDFSLD